MYIQMRKLFIEKIRKLSNQYQNNIMTQSTI